MNASSDAVLIHNGWRIIAECRNRLALLTDLDADLDASLDVADEALDRAQVRITVLKRPQEAARG